tara:strand:+ start:174 stop:314 length:141 start_codon:yes stop_codon:yes gene_type:complete
MANEKYMQAAKARRKKRKKKKFPDLNKDGKITYADVLIGRGVKRKK